MNSYSMNIAERTGVPHPPYRHYALVQLGDNEQQARAKAQEIAMMFRDSSLDGQFHFQFQSVQLPVQYSEEI